jgi:hypothetical protein
VKTCSVDGCDGVVQARGWCHKHYLRWRKYGDVLHPVRVHRIGWDPYDKVMDRLVSVSCRYDHLGPCAEFSGARLPAGYGLVVGPETLYAHRVVWEHHNGPIPDGLLVCHHCDNPPCCEILHLYLGDKTKNADDMIARARGNNGRPYLTIAQVLAIRADTRLLREIAADYGVSTSTVSDIRRRKRWANIDLPDR